MSSLQTQSEVRRIFAAFGHPQPSQKSYLIPPDPGHPTFRHLFAIDSSREEGHFVVLSKDGKLGVLNRETFKSIVDEGRAAKLGGRWNIHAAFASYTSANVVFYKWSGKDFERIVFK